VFTRSPAYADSSGAVTKDRGRARRVLDWFSDTRRSKEREMTPAPPIPVVHLELHTGDLERARTFYEDLCGWRAERLDAGSRSYLALELGRRFGGGIVECPTERPLWRARRSHRAVPRRLFDGEADWVAPKRASGTRLPRLALGGPEALSLEEERQGVSHFDRIMSSGVYCGA
jgi:catechol 2,3-dioxygenase-like lactoylglutathione lyase family enzyme